ncbi:TATA box-binding protein-associated factor RNA polymerase I subunit D isoform X1 [Ornithorhynchus anatinus]|uniref:TATA box-binding protein-associated factor RNA polymerase I subunit D n=1 Tax=Ornithorhynchus anatinus TaxID=9258 RepID=F6Z8M8_ORNAN|nr:TATA box-binding protein-associated factor RNA polymerase I subunit D isoform X1 [Ornithorhynchus anatinus]XP_007666312.2 TATA box-binding protein-associated factor RNA polymerase I subunit D isoform X1 [Ornithorhynchus anatinus]
MENESTPGKAPRRNEDGGFVPSRNSLSRGISSKSVSGQVMPVVSTISLEESNGSNCSDSGSSLFRTQSAAALPKRRLRSQSSRNSIKSVAEKPVADSSSDSSSEMRLPYVLRADFKCRQKRKYRKKKYKPTGNPRGRPKGTRGILNIHTTQEQKRLFGDKGFQFPLIQRELRKKQLPWKMILTYEQAVARGFFNYIERLKFEKSLKEALSQLDTGEDVDNEELHMRGYRYVDDEGAISPIEELNAEDGGDSDDPDRWDARIVENSCFILSTKFPKKEKGKKVEVEWHGPAAPEEEKTVPGDRRSKGGETRAKPTQEPNARETPRVLSGEEVAPSQKKKEDQPGIPRVEPQEFLEEQGTVLPMKDPKSDIPIDEEEVLTEKLSEKETQIMPNERKPTDQPGVQATPLMEVEIAPRKKKRRNKEETRSICVGQDEPMEGENAIILRRAETKTVPNEEADALTRSSASQKGAVISRKKRLKSKLVDQSNVDVDGEQEVLTGETDSRRKKKDCGSGAVSPEQMEEGETLIAFSGEEASLLKSQPETIPLCRRKRSLGEPGELHRNGAAEQSVLSEEHGEVIPKKKRKKKKNWEVGGAYPEQMGDRETLMAPERMESKFMLAGEEGFSVINQNPEEIPLIRRKRPHSEHREFMHYEAISEVSGTAEQCVLNEEDVVQVAPKKKKKKKKNQEVGDEEIVIVPQRMESKFTLTGEEEFLVINQQPEETPLIRRKGLHSEHGEPKQYEAISEVNGGAEQSVLNEGDVAPKKKKKKKNREVGDVYPEQMGDGEIMTVPKRAESKMVPNGEERFVGLNQQPEETPLFGRKKSLCEPGEVQVNGAAEQSGPSVEEAPRKKRKKKKNQEVGDVYTEQMEEGETLRASQKIESQMVPNGKERFVLLNQQPEESPLFGRKKSLCEPEEVQVNGAAEQSGPSVEEAPRKKRKKKKNQDVRDVYTEQTEEGETLRASQKIESKMVPNGDERLVVLNQQPEETPLFGRKKSLCEPREVQENGAAEQSGPSEEQPRKKRKKKNREVGGVYTEQMGEAETPIVPKRRKSKTVPTEEEGSLFIDQQSEEAHLLPGELMQNKALTEANGAAEQRVPRQQEAVAKKKKKRRKTQVDQPANC